MGLKKLFKESFSSDVDEVVEYIKSKIGIKTDYIDISNKYPILGEGAQATVYEINKKALRIADAYLPIQQTYDKLVENDFDYVVNVLFNKVLKIGKKHHMITVMEILDPLDDYEMEEMKHFDEYFDYPYTKEMYEELINLSELKDIEHILDDVYLGIQELNKIGIKPFDIWRENIMKDPVTKKYKLIDIIDE